MNALLNQLRRLNRDPSAFRAEPALENVYRHLFTRDLAVEGHSDIFYPTGGAANYSLLYLIQRIGNDLRPASVLDIGAGQTSLLWNLMAQRGKVGKVTTLEGDEGWGASLASRVDHEVLVTSLSSKEIAGVSTYTYDWDAARKRGPFDVIICDGPIGVRRFSRFGVLALLDDTLPDDFVLVLDDVERAGEQDTIRAVHDRLRQLGRNYQAGVIRAAKSQAVFAAGRYTPICFV